MLWIISRQSTWTFFLVQLLPPPSTTTDWRDSFLDSDPSHILAIRFCLSGCPSAGQTPHSSDLPAGGRLACWPCFWNSNDQPASLNWMACRRGLERSTIWINDKVSSSHRHHADNSQHNNPNLFGTRKLVTKIVPNLNTVITCKQPYYPKTPNNVSVKGFLVDKRRHCEASRWCVSNYVTWDALQRMLYVTHELVITECQVQASFPQGTLRWLMYGHYTTHIVLTEKKPRSRKCHSWMC